MGHNYWFLQNHKEILMVELSSHFHPIIGDYRKPKF